MKAVDFLKEQKYDKIQRLAEIFPDLEICHDRWQHRYLVAKSANPKVTDVDFKYSCGCCNDSARYAMPYLIVEGERIYCKPYQFVVGEKNPRNYFKPLWGSAWQEDMKNNEIAPVVLGKIKRIQVEEEELPEEEPDEG